MKTRTIEDLLLFLDVIITGEEFAEYSAEEREAMFREIRAIVEARWVDGFIKRPSPLL